MPNIQITELSKLVGKEIGVSAWQIITQERINDFAQCTDDQQFIHVNEQRARTEGPFGGTVAHGFLSLSLLSKFAYDTAVSLEGVKTAVNYGFNRVRFIQPVRAGNSVRARFELIEATERAPNQWILTYRVTLEIDNETKPALVADWLTMQII